MYHKIGWTQQFHLGAIRNNNKRLLDELGPDTGFDSIGDFSQARALSGVLNKLDSTNQLAKTIVYNLNPADSEVFATMVGNFNDGTIKGKMQYGAAWWFLDQKDGRTHARWAHRAPGPITRGPHCGAHRGVCQEGASTAGRVPEKGGPNFGAGGLGEHLRV